MKWYILGLSILLTGCIQLLPDAKDPPKKVFLTPKISTHAQYKQRPLILSILRPHSSSDLASTRLRIIHPCNELPIGDVIAGFEWEEKLPELLQGYLVQSLEGSQLFKGVINGNDHIKANWLLTTEIRHFDVVNICAPYVVIELEFKVVSLPLHSLVSQRVFRYKQPLNCLSLSNILSAYSELVEMLLRDLEKWLASLQEPEPLSPA